MLVAPRGRSEASTGSYASDQGMRGNLLSIPSADIGNLMILHVDCFSGETASVHFQSSRFLLAYLGRALTPASTFTCLLRVRQAALGLSTAPDNPGADAIVRHSADLKPRPFMGMG